MGGETKEQGLKQAVSKRQEKIGIVTSARMQKTIVVEVHRRVPHPVYKKIVTRRSKFLAHDEQRQAREGDIVRIVETHPLSRRKRWRLKEIVQSSTLKEA